MASSGRSIPGCDGEVDQRRWLQADAEQLYVWRCPGDCGDAGVAGDTAAKAEFTAKADKMHELIETKLWNPKDQFYEVISPAAEFRHSEGKEVYRSGNADAVFGRSGVDRLYSVDVRNSAGLAWCGLEAVIRS